MSCICNGYNAACRKLLGKLHTTTSSPSSSHPNITSAPQQCNAQAVEVRKAADEYTAQAGAAGQRATAAEQEAQHLEAQGKFADAAAAALQADRSDMLM